jgi:hypothetical protein
MKSRARHDGADAACDDGVMQHRRKGALVSVALLLTLAACGSGSDGAASPAADKQPAATEAPTGDDFSESDTTEAVANPTDPVATEVPEAEGEQPVVTEAAPEGEDSHAERVATDVPEVAAPAEPVVGGRLFAADVQPATQVDGNPFPDLVVDDIGKDAQVNIKNILPSDRPVLLWAWAPH